jgi:hypothetical protein
MIERMKQPLIIFFALMTLAGHAQVESQTEAYKDELIGWKVVYHFHGPRKPQQVDDKAYSPQQMSYMDTITNWMQASYTPRGTLGDIKRRALYKVGIYDTYNRSLPHSYGAEAYSYIFLKKMDGKWVNETTHSYLWRIMANEVPEYHIGLLSTETQYYFTIPGLDSEELKDPKSIQSRDKKLYDLSDHPVIGKYINLMVPSFGQPLRRNVVILSKDNRFPFVQLSIGEVLRIAEANLTIKLDIEKKVIIEQNQGMQKMADMATANAIQKTEKARATISRLREKYKDSMGKPAYLSSGDLSVIDLANGSDPFTGHVVGEYGSVSTTFPVYQVDPELQALCKTDHPQWIYIQWVGGELYDAGFKQMHEAIINNFNFDYAYNFFFAPEKVAGQPYKPRRSPDQLPVVAATEASETAKKMNSDPSVLFYEDFSRNAPGQAPSGWTYRMNLEGVPPQVVTPAGEPGKWLALKGNSATRLFPGGPAPENFSLTFRLAVPKGFTWGGNRLDIALSTGNVNGGAEEFVSLQLRPGFDGRDGFGYFESQWTGTKPLTGDFSAPKFSNDKPLNIIEVTLKKKGRTLECRIGGTQVAFIPDILPPNLNFTKLRLTHASSDDASEVYYVGQIKITKD